MDPGNIWPLYQILAFLSSFPHYFCLYSYDIDNDQMLVINQLLTGDFNMYVICYWFAKNTWAKYVYTNNIFFNCQHILCTYPIDYLL